MPSGDDAVPWLGDYPFGGAGGNQGVHMIGLAANRPAPSLGTRVGSDGAVSGGSTAFSAASGRFVSANTGDTIRIVDTAALPAVVYSFTVTYVSATALTLSSAWAGTGTSNLSWSLLGQGPSNAGLRYFATDTPAEYESTGTDWLELPQGGGSSLIFWPAADQAHASLDSSTYPNNYTGSGHYETLVTTAGNSGPALALAIAGDAYPRRIDTFNVGTTSGFAESGIMLGDGTADPLSVGCGIANNVGDGTPGHNELVLFDWQTAVASTGYLPNDTGISTFSTFVGAFGFGWVQGVGNGTTYMSAGKGVPALGAWVGDLYWRNDGAAGTYLYICTVAGGHGAATWVAIL